MSATHERQQPFTLTPPRVRVLTESTTHRLVFWAAAQRPGEWLTLHEIVRRVAEARGRPVSQTAVSARVRELRRLGYTVDVRVVGRDPWGTRYEYRITRGAP